MSRGFGKFFDVAASGVGQNFALEDLGFDLVGDLVFVHFAKLSDKGVQLGVDRFFIVVVDLREHHQDLNFCADEFFKFFLCNVFEKHCFVGSLNNASEVPVSNFF